MTKAARCSRCRLTTRERFKKIRARFATPPSSLNLPGVLSSRKQGREWEIVANGNSAQLLEALKQFQPEEVRSESLSLEEIFVNSRTLARSQP